MIITDRLPEESGRDYALRILKNNIVRLQLEPGSKVSENEMAATLGLSRTPVREALIELSKVNIVEIYPQKGSYIALIDPHLVNQSFFMRQTLECEVVKEVCQKASETDLENLRASMREQELFSRAGSLETGAGDIFSFMELDNQFHRLLYEIAGKELVYQIIQEIAIHFDRVRNLTINHLKPDAITRQHREILTAIEERDEYLAAAQVRRHLNRFRNIKKELYEKHRSYFADPQGEAAL